MDISKSSNFERYACDVLGRDYAKVNALWTGLEREGMFDLAGSEDFRRVGASGFVSGASSHADRVATIRQMHERYGVIVDPHTADGIKVGLRHRENGVPLICLETAQPAKFAETIREALGRDPDRPAGFESIEKLPQRVEVMDAALEQVQRFIEARVRD